MQVKTIFRMILSKTKYIISLLHKTYSLWNRLLSWHIICVYAIRVYAREYFPKFLSIQVFPSIVFLTYRPARGALTEQRSVIVLFFSQFVEGRDSFLRIFERDDQRTEFVVNRTDATEFTFCEEKRDRLANTTPQQVPGEGAGCIYV